MQKIIIDTDIGDDIDDAFAIALALELEDVEVIGITTVFRNAKARAKQVVELLKSVGKDNIEVCAGADNPLISTPQNFKKEFYDDNGKYLPCQYDTSYETNRISDKNAIDFIIESANKYNGELVLAPIGALTNIALALRTDNDLCKKIKKIVLMGGYDSYAIPEWNIMCDSEAARIVFTSGVPIYTVGLDVTTKCALNSDLLDRISKKTDKRSKLIISWLNKWEDAFHFHKSVLHDPLAIATIVSDCVTFECKSMKVYLNGKLNGITKKVRYNSKDKSQSKIYVATKVDAAKFYRLFEEKLVN